MKCMLQRLHWGIDIYDKCQEVAHEITIVPHLDGV